jgi:hypothetical protein
MPDADETAAYYAARAPDYHERSGYADPVAERVADGKRFSVVKNIPTEQEIRDALRGIGENVEYAQTPESGWRVSYTVG